MQRRGLIVFVILNVFISLGVAFAVISFFSPQTQPPSEVQVITVEIRVTNTRAPTQTPWIITVTPESPVVAQLPTGLFETPVLADGSPLPTIDATIIGSSLSLQGTATALPQGCILHTIKDGDTPFGIAEEYGTDGFKLMEVNGLDDTAAAALQIGDTLIVPLEGCSLTAADVVRVAAEEPTEEPTEEATVIAEITDEAGAVLTDEAGAPLQETPTPRPSPTLTLPPTAANASVSILQVIEPGDVTAEAVEIQNTGATVNIAGWTLSDADGNTFTFPEQLLFSNARLTVSTRTGANTPLVLFWNRDDAVWQPGDVVTLRDKNGAVQSTFRVPTPVDLE